MISFKSVPSFINFQIAKYFLDFKLSPCSVCCMFSSGSEFSDAGKLPRRKHTTAKYFLNSVSIAYNINGFEVYLLHTIPVAVGLRELEVRY